MSKIKIDTTDIDIKFWKTVKEEKNLFKANKKLKQNKSKSN